MTAVESSPAPSMRVYVLVWAMLVLVVAAEVAMTMAHPSPVRLLVALLTLAFVEAAVALLYFMHLRWEPRILFWSLVPALVFVLVMMDNFFPDALRLMHQRLPHQ
jgi:heme/copper-type cytochrome/quinol oxidase subunit 4